MVHRSPQFTTARRAGRASLVALLALAVVLFGALAGYLRSLERRAGRAAVVNDRLAPGGVPRPLTEVAQLIRTQKLVTVEVNSAVTARAEDESWRGDVNAAVTAPVRLLYGVDLSELQVDALAFSPVSGAYILRVPRPERIATEIHGDREQFDLQLGWARFRTRAGEYYLGQARRSLYEQARSLALTHEQAEEVIRATEEQLVALVRRIVGERAAVTVIFRDEAPP